MPLKSARHKRAEVHREAIPFFLKRCTLCAAAGCAGSHTAPVLREGGTNS